MSAEDVYRWIVPPSCAGQIVEVSYGSDHGGLVYRRTYDRSDRSEVIEVADAADCGCGRECNCFDPANVEPSGYGWEVAS